MPNTLITASHPAARRFYTVVAWVLVLIVFAGFAQTYYLKGIYGTPPLPLLVHIHGVVMTLWYALFVIQVGLVASRRIALHRTLGFAGVGLSILVIILGTLVSLGLARQRLLVRPDSTGAAFLLGLQLFSVLLVFGIFVSLGVFFRRRTDIHKRLMTLAMLSVLGPAITRLPLSFVQNHDVSMAIALSIGFVVLCILGDTILHRRLHPAFAWGGALIVGSMVVVAQFAQSQTWIRATRWLVL